MATSDQVRIRAAVAALLLGGTAMAGGRVRENRDLSMSNDVTSQVHVNFTRSQPVDAVIYTGHPRDWMTDIELVFLARKTGGSEAADVADAMWVEAYSRLMADQTLGGLAGELLPGEAFVDNDQADASLCRLTWSVTVRHRTNNDTLSS